MTKHERALEVCEAVAAMFPEGSIPEEDFAGLVEAALAAHGLADSL